MGGDSGGYEEAQETIGRGMEEQRGLEKGAEQAYGAYGGLGGYAIPRYEQALGQGADPTALYHQFMSQYRESPELQAQIAAGEKGAGHAAAASGMLGSGAEMQAAAGRSQALRGQDIQNYLSRVMGLRQQYLGGMGGLAGMGLQGAQGIAGARMGLGQQLGEGYGGLARSQIGAAQQGGGMGSTIGTVAGGILGSFGGPAGAVAGAGIGGAIGGQF